MNRRDAPRPLAFPPGHRRGERLRAGLGLAVTGGPLVALAVAGTVTWPVGLVLGGAAAVFAAYGLSLAGEDALFLDDRGLSDRRGRRVDWADLRGLGLAWYRPRREGPGWQVLTLTGPDHRFRLDSRMVGFDDVLRLAVAAARARGLVLDPATISNLSALEIAMTPEPQ